MSGFFYALYRISKNEQKESFAVQLSTTLLLSSFGATGFFVAPLSYLIRGVLGLFLEAGIFQIDVLLDAYKEGEKRKTFEEMAEAAWKKTTAKVYDEKEKDRIRAEYLEIISRIGVVGSPK